MLKIELDVRKNIHLSPLLPFALIVFIINISVTVFAQNPDSITVQPADSVTSIVWQPKILPELNQFDPSRISQPLQLVVPNNKAVKFYNPNNVMPKNFWEMDYRGTSYYTPRIVSDRLAQMMDRLPPDSFVPLPAIAFLAARLALKYADIQFKIEIKATDYLIDERLEIILISLLQKSPQTAKDLYQSKEVSQSRTMEMLKTDLQTLLDQKIIKRRKMETEPDKYYAAQDVKTITQLIQYELESETATVEQKQKLSRLSGILSTLNEDTE